MIDAMKQALEALEYHQEQTRPIHKTQETITALRQAIEEAEKLCKYCGGIGRVVCDGRCMPEQEPVAWIQEDRIVPELGYDCTMTREHPKELGYAPVYTSPPRKEWVGLTVQDYREFLKLSGFDAFKAIEAKLKEKNT
jgi:hypothetical protein